MRLSRWRRVQTETAPPAPPDDAVAGEEAGEALGAGLATGSGSRGERAPRSSGAVCSSTARRRP